MNYITFIEVKDSEKRREAKGSSELKNYLKLFNVVHLFFYYIII